MDNRLIIAIDIGTESIKVFVGEKKPGEELLVKNSAFVPTKGYEKGEITDADALALAAKQALDCVVSPAGGQAADALIYLGISSIFMLGQNSLGSIAPLAAGKITQDDIERAFKAAIFAAVADDFEVLHAFPVNDNLPGKDKPEKGPGLPQEGQGLKINYHIAALPKMIIKELTNAFRMRGIKIAGIVSNSLVAAQNTMANLTAAEDNRIFFDIGAGTADFAFLVEGVVNYSASLPLGGRYITKDIARGLDVSFFHAEAIKRYYAKLDRALYGQGVILDCNDFGTTDKSVPYDFLHDIVEGRVDEIIYLLHEYSKPKLDEYIYNKGKLPERIILAGGSAFLPSLVDKLSSAFDTKVETANLARLAPEYNCPANAACYGVFCYAGSEAVKHKSARVQPYLPRRLNSLNSSKISSPWSFLKENIGEIFKL